MDGEFRASMTINEVLKRFPATTGVFNRYNMDACCGGARTLEQASREDGVELQTLLADLARAAGRQ